MRFILCQVAILRFSYVGIVKSEAELAKVVWTKENLAKETQALKAYSL